MKAQVVDRRGRDTHAIATTANVSLSDKVFKGGKIGVIVLLAGLASIVIPIVHFVSVPFGVLVGLALIFKSIASTKKYSFVDLTCPSCGKAQNVSVLGQGNVVHHNCTACDEPLKVKFV